MHKGSKQTMLVKFKIWAQIAPESILEHLNFKNFLREHAPRTPGLAVRPPLPPLAAVAYSTVFSYPFEIFWISAWLGIFDPEL